MPRLGRGIHGTTPTTGSKGQERTCCFVSRAVPASFGVATGKEEALWRLNLGLW